MKKLFRQHRNLLDESMETCKEVSGISDIISILSEIFPQGYLSNIHIDNKSIDDSSRLGEEWKDTRYVLADFDRYKAQCLGMCNFYEDGRQE